MEDKKELSKPTLTIRHSGNHKLIERVKSHLGEEALDFTKDEIVHYVDGGQYGGTPDPRSLAAKKQEGSFTSQGSAGPKKTKP